MVVSDEMERQIRGYVADAAEKRGLSQEEQQRLARAFRFDVFVCGQCFYNRETGRRVDPARVTVKEEKRQESINGDSVEGE